MSPPVCWGSRHHCMTLDAFQDAEELFQSALGEYDTEVGAAHPLAATALLNIGMIRRLREQFREAEPMLRSSLEMRRSLYGDYHPQTLEALEELATLLNSTRSLLRGALTNNQCSGLGNDKTRGDAPDDSFFTKGKR